MVVVVDGSWPGAGAEVVVVVASGRIPRDVVVVVCGGDVVPGFEREVVVDGGKIGTSCAAAGRNA